METTQQRPALARRLINQNLIEPELLDHALDDARQAGQPIVRHLLDQELIPPAELAQAAAGEFGLTLLSSGELTAQNDAIERVDPEVIRQHHALPIAIEHGHLKVAISDPANVNGLDEMRFQSGLPIEPVLAPDDLLTERIAALLGPVEHELQQASAAVEARDEADSQGTSEDAPVVRFINRMLERAMAENASDIHFEPFEKHCRVRFRRDGVLRDIANAPAGIAPRLSARIKVMARLDLAERRVPQDGRLRLTNEPGHSVDFRVSSCPTLFGEKLVLRLLNPDTTRRAMDDLGLNDQQLKAYRQAIAQPQGMVLVTGPTGSGKTVTLYSALQALNNSSRNILSVEDPVEIDLPGINQVAINLRAGLDFPHALRAFLRQDPDVIMVGEIRDNETADIAIKAAQTGHLVFSTLHTNNAVAAITRLTNMDIPAWNIAASVSLVIAQRLVRRLCPNCRRMTTLEPAAILSSSLNHPLPEVMNCFEAVGCSGCIDGYEGRVGIHEVLPITSGVRDLIAQQASPEAITAAAESAGFCSLQASAIAALQAGQTSLSELKRVIGW